MADVCLKLEFIPVLSLPFKSTSMQRDNKPWHPIPNRIATHHDILGWDNFLQGHISKSYLDLDRYFNSKPGLELGDDFKSSTNNDSSKTHMSIVDGSTVEVLTS